MVGQVKKKPGKQIGRLVVGRGKNLPEDLRSLPSSFVTEDIGENDKIHVLDAPHTKRSMAKELAAKQGPQKKEEEGPRVPGGHLSQERIDLEIARALRNLANNAANDYANGRPQDRSVKHIWFPTPDPRVIEMRQGNPPPDSERPAHLKGKWLVIDINNPILPSFRRQLLTDPLVAFRFEERVGEMYRTALEVLNVVRPRPESDNGDEGCF